MPVPTPTGGQTIATKPNEATEATSTEEPAAPAAEKAVLTVRLESFEASAKAKIIREVKALMGCNLVEAKTLVEKAPTVLKENVVRDVRIRECNETNFKDAKKVKETMEKLGAKVSLL